MKNHCGNCTACCKVFNIPELDKPAGKWCDHCKIGSGCKIYEERPEICSDFKCLWLESQNHPNEQLSPGLRPDKCKIVFSPTTNPKIISATIDKNYPLAWKEGEAFELIKFIAKEGGAVVVGYPNAPKRTMIKRDLDKIIAKEVQMTEPDENGMQWSKDE